MSLMQVAFSQEISCPSCETFFFQEEEEQRLNQTAVIIKPRISPSANIIAHVVISDEYNGGKWLTIVKKYFTQAGTFSLRCKCKSSKSLYRLRTFQDFVPSELVRYTLMEYNAYVLPVSLHEPKRK